MKSARVFLIALMLCTVAACSKPEAGEGVSAEVPAEGHPTAGDATAAADSMAAVEAAMAAKPSAVPLEGGTAASANASSGASE